MMIYLVWERDYELPDRLIAAFYFKSHAERYVASRDLDYYITEVFVQ